MKIPTVEEVAHKAGRNELNPLERFVFVYSPEEPEDLAITSFPSDLSEVLEWHETQVIENLSPDIINRLCADLSRR